MKCLIPILVLVTATAAPGRSPPPASKTQLTMVRGLEYLRSQQQPDGGWQKENDPPAITALVVRAFVLDPRYDSKTDFVVRGYQKLLSYQLDTGGIYKDMLANYNTAIAISAMAA